jgi:hypothetical protein
LVTQASVISRRRFLAGASLVAGAVAGGACRDGDAGHTPEGAGDLDRAREHAGLEKLAYDSYAGIRRLSTDGKLGAATPPALTGLLITAGRQHELAMEAWNKVLADAGRPAVDVPPEKLRAAVDLATIRVADVVAAARLALRLEDYVARSYQRSIPLLQAPEVVTLAARVSVVGAQHQAVLRYLVGLDPVGSGDAPGTLDVAPADPHITQISG